MWRITRSGHICDMEPAFPSGRVSAEQSSRPEPDGAPQSRHDQQHGPAREWARIRSGWDPVRLVPTTPLTDELIEKRRKQGYYSDAYREAIRAAAKERAALAALKEGR